MLRNNTHMSLEEKECNGVERDKSVIALRSVYKELGMISGFSLKVIYYVLKQYFEKAGRFKNKRALYKALKSMFLCTPHCYMEIHDKYFFTKKKSALLSGFLGKKRRKTKVLFLKATKRRKILDKEYQGYPTNQITQDIVEGIISSLIDQAIEVSNRNNLQFDKPYQSLTPTFSIKTFSFELISPLSSPVSCFNPLLSCGELSSTTATSPTGKTSYPLTSTHSNTIHNHIMIIHNSANSSKSSAFTSSPDANPKQFPFNAFPMHNPYFHPQSLPTLDYFSTEGFYIKLNKDITEFTKSIDNYNALLYEARLKLIEIVKSIAYESLLLYDAHISFELFGSFANGLSIESSDIDLLLKYSLTQSCEQTFIQLLNVSFKSSGLFSLVFPIPSAKIPVIKLIAPLPSFLTADVLDVINKAVPSIDSMSIDIVFSNVCYSAYLPSLEIVNYIKNAIKLVPCLKGIMFFLKKFLIKKKLNSYYNGGLSSFSLFVLLFSLIKYRGLFGHHNLKNSAFILIHFLDFYSKFNFDCYGVNINLSYSYGFIGPNAINMPMIIDPITNMNIGSGTFKIDEIKKSFESLMKELKASYAQGKGNIIDMILNS